MKRRRITITAFRRRTTVVLANQFKERRTPPSQFEASEQPWIVTHLTLFAAQRPKIGEMIMNPKTRIVTAVLGVSLMFSVFDFPQSAVAQSARGFLVTSGNTAQPASVNSNCKKISGSGVQVFDPLTGIVSGPVTNSGILDGTIEDVINFGAGFVFTPNPTVVAYTTNLTITTIHGELKASPVTTQSIVTGAGAEWGLIDSNTSTGKFAGATGTISVVFKPVGDPSVGPYESEIKADICFAP